MTAKTTDTRKSRGLPPANYWIAKRFLDVILSLGALIAFAIPMLLISLLVKVDDRSAPIFFRQVRSGAGGRRFYLYKFRTMVKNADSLKEQLWAESIVDWPLFKLEEDPRTTRIGRFLRKSKLDELPQLLNVLKGDMSLVGPRPTSFDVSAYDLWHTARLDFRPGITGPWQVLGHDGMNFDERCRLDITFFRRPSIWAEMKLLLATVRVVFRRAGAA